MDKLWANVEKKLANASVGFRIENEDRMVEVTREGFDLYRDWENVGFTIYVDTATGFLKG